MKKAHAIYLWNDTCERLVGTDCDGDSIGNLTAFAGAAMHAGVEPSLTHSVPGNSGSEVVKRWWKATLFLREWADAIEANIPGKEKPKEPTAKEVELRKVIEDAEKVLADCSDYFETERDSLKEPGTVYDECYKLWERLKKAIEENG